jgi:hypothetical protein
MYFGDEHLHVRCCAHILNILVQDGLVVAHRAIDKILELVKQINSSPSRIQVFNEIVKRLELPLKAGLTLNILNHWDLTHDMIMEAIEYKVILKRYAKEQLELSPDDEEWKNSQAIGEFLGAFEEATKAFSTHRTPTSHLFCIMCYVLIKLLEIENGRSTMC